MVDNRVEGRVDTAEGTGPGQFAREDIAGTADMVEAAGVGVDTVVEPAERRYTRELHGRRGNTGCRWRCRYGRMDNKRQAYFRSTRIPTVPAGSARRI